MIYNIEFMYIPYMYLTSQYLLFAVQERGEVK